MDRFAETHLFTNQRFSLGRDNATKGYYIALPVSTINRAAEFEAFFAISAVEYASFAANPEAALLLAQALIGNPEHSRRLK